VVVLKQVGSARDFLGATGLLHSVEVGRGLDVPCRVVLPDHPVVNQVPERFTSASSSAWFEVAESDAQVYAATLEGQPVVIGRDMGDGRVVLIGFDYSDYTEASARLLANALRATRAAERKRFVRGDVTQDGRVDVSDAIFILDFLFRGGRTPGCLDSADVDDSAQPGASKLPVNVNDPVVLLQWLFGGGPSPPAPSPSATPPQTCGPDRQLRDDLECEDYAGC